MAILIGQVYHPKLKEEMKDGETKVSFHFSLGTRKAFVDDPAKSNVFTPCVTYQAGLARVLNEHFGKPEHHGKPIVVYGHFHEFEWYPDPNNPDHEKFFQPFNITEDILHQGGIRFAEGSARQITILVPIKQTTRQFVVTGFEFVDSAMQSSKPSFGSSVPVVKVAGVTANTSTTSTQAPAQSVTVTPSVGAGLPVDSDIPF